MVNFIGSGSLSPGKCLDLFWEYHLGLNKMFKLMSINSYSDENIIYHFHFRVNGDIVEFRDPIGCSFLRYFSKDKKVGITITLGEEQSTSIENLENFLFANIFEALILMTDRIEKEGITINKKILQDFKVNLKAFFKNILI